MRTPFLGSSYVARSTNIADARMVNLYPEKVETGQGFEVASLIMCPGLDLLATVGPGPIRLILNAPTVPTQCLVISGSEVHVVDNNFKDLGTIANLHTATGTVQAISNSTQFFIVDGVDGYYIDGPSGLTFAGVINAQLGVSPSTTAYQDGFGVITQTNTQQQTWFQSNLNDFRTWQPLNFSSADGGPDPIVRAFDLHREVWLMGSQSIEVWINAGLPGFAFQRLQGVFIEVGIVAPYSAARVGQGVMWLGADQQGYGIVMRSAGGYVPDRVSTFAVENAIRNYARIDDAFAYCYQSHGHTFYVLTFPSADATWVYDATPRSGGEWHERASFVNGQFHRHIGAAYGFFNGQHLIGDSVTGNIYRYNLDNATDNGAQRKWLRSWRAFPQGKAPNVPIDFESLDILMEKGIRVPAGLNPQMCLRFSNDGGNSWSNEYKQPMGQTGQTTARTTFGPLGSTRRGRDRVYELSGTDPVPVILLGAEQEANPA